MMVSDGERLESEMEDTQGSMPADGTYGSLRVANESELAYDPPAREWIFPAADELFRSIYTRAGMGFTSQEVLGVSSAIRGEGKTTLCLGLAVTIAQDFPSTRVLLVETDFQNPALASDFGVEPDPGLIECLSQNLPIQNAYRATFLENLHIVPVGSPVSGAGRVLRSMRIASALDVMRQTHDVIIMDLPAILANSDAVLLTDLADGVVCVVRAGVTPADLVSKALSQVEESKIRGVVLNGSDSAVPGWLRRIWGAY